MKIFISQPMKGKSVDEVLSERGAVVRFLENNGHEVVCNVSPEYSSSSHKNAPLYYLSKSIESLSACDAIIFLDGWETARGCKIEHSIAESYNIPIYSSVNLKDLTSTGK